MRILQIVGLYGRAGGIETHMFDLFETPPHAGHSCALIYGVRGLGLNLDKESQGVAYVNTFIKPQAANLLASCRPSWGAVSPAEIASTSHYSFKSSDKYDAWT